MCRFFRLIDRLGSGGSIAIHDQELSLLVLRWVIIAGVRAICYWDRIALELGVVSRCHRPKLSSFTISILCDAQCAFVLS